MGEFYDMHILKKYDFAFKKSGLVSVMAVNMKCTWSQPGGLERLRKHMSTAALSLSPHPELNHICKVPFTTESTTFTSSGGADLFRGSIGLPPTPILPLSFSSAGVDPKRTS